MTGIQKEQPFVSVVIPTYRDWERLKLCIRALNNQTYPENNFEVIIVNNDPKDQAPNLDLPHHFRLIAEPKAGSYAARNTGITCSKGEIIAFTDSDCIPDSKWIEEGVKLLQSTPGLHRVAGKVELFFSGPSLTAAEIYEKAFAFRQNVNAKKGLSVTANLMTDRNTLTEVGMFDESFMSGGDMDWNLKAEKMGFAIQYGANCIVRHPARRNISELTKKVKRVAGGAHIYLKDAQKKIIFGSPGGWLHLFLV